MRLKCKLISSRSRKRLPHRPQVRERSLEVLLEGESGMAPVMLSSSELVLDLKVTGKAACRVVKRPLGSCLRYADEDNDVRVICDENVDRFESMSLGLVCRSGDG